MMTKPLPMDDHKKSVIWREWERGTPMASIARIIDKPPATVFHIFSVMGVSDRGIASGVPRRLAWKSVRRFRVAFLMDIAFDLSPTLCAAALLL